MGCKFEPMIRYATNLSAVASLVLGFVVLCGAAHAATPTSGAEESPPRKTSAIESLLSKASRKNRYEPLSAGNMRTWEALFARTMAGEVNIRQLEKQWQLLGWRLRQVSHNDESFLVLYEHEQKRGGGFYAIRVESDCEVVLQAPHAFADRHTRLLALEFFESGTFRAAAWNTVHRKHVDIAHTRVHAFNAFMQAAAANRPDTLFVQLHGFAKHKRDTAAGVSTDLIVSDGTRNPSRWVRNAAALLQHTLPDTTTRLFPYEVRELGALTNVQSQMLRQLSSRRFLHLELSLGLRERLLVNDALRHEMLKDLEKIYRLSKR